MSGRGAQLREAMANGMVLAPFVYDGFTALIAAGQGAQAVYMTGHGTSAQLGLPDVGLTSMAEMAANLGYISNAVDVPVIADADTGYGNAINAQRTVREYETAGAAAMHLEDQIFPGRVPGGRQRVGLAEVPLIAGHAPLAGAVRLHDVDMVEIALGFVESDPITLLRPIHPAGAFLEQADDLVVLPAREADHAAEKVHPAADGIGLVVRASGQ